MLARDSDAVMLLFFITPKAAHNRQQHNPKHKGKNIHKHTKIRTEIHFLIDDTFDRVMWASDVGM